VSFEASAVVSRRELARLLRQLRQEHGLSLDEASRRTGLDAGFLSRAERGLRGLSDDSIEKLVELYRVPQRVAADLRQFARTARQTSWWDDPQIPRPIQRYIGMEQAATAISIYGSFAPGLLQTRMYADAVVRATDPGGTDEDRAAVIAQRLRRQAVLDRPDPPWLSVILDESVLHRVVGGAEVHREQLRKLRAAAGRPRTDLHIVRFDAGAHPGMDSRFVMVSTTDDRKVDFVHVEGLSGFRNYERPADVGGFVRAWQQLIGLARSPVDSIALVDTVLAAGELPR
jgi:transcriptional regulator with XRE-family HTH domain